MIHPIATKFGKPRIAKRGDYWLCFGGKGDHYAIGTTPKWAYRWWSAFVAGTAWPKVELDPKTGRYIEVEWSSMRKITNFLWPEDMRVR